MKVSKQSDPAPYRIFRVTFRSAAGRRRKATTLVKIPYNDAGQMAERLMRAEQQGELLWFRVDRPAALTVAERASLRRWPEALQDVGGEVGITWLR